MPIQRRICLLATIAGLAAVLAHAADTSPRDLVAPFKIVGSTFYADGGTTSFKIVDARGQIVIGGFDGRICDAFRHGKGNEPDTNRCGPGHMFVGAEHAAKPGARSLPLWGEDERTIIRVLDSALDTQLTPAMRQSLLNTDGAKNLPEDPSRELWHLVRYTERRKSLLASIDRGFPDDVNCFRSYIGTTGLITIASIALVDSTCAYEVVMTDSIGKRFGLAIPTDSMATPHPSLMRFPPTEYRDFVVLNTFGAMGDRCALTALALLLPTMESDVEGVELREPLTRIVQWRIRRTFETDSTR